MPEKKCEGNKQHTLAFVRRLRNVVRRGQLQTLASQGWEWIRFCSSVRFWFSQVLPSPNPRIASAFQCYCFSRVLECLQASKARAESISVIQTRLCDCLRRVCVRGNIRGRCFFCSCSRFDSLQGDCCTQQCRVVWLESGRKKEIPHFVLAIPRLVAH